MPLASAGSTLHGPGRKQGSRSMTSPKKRRSVCVFFGRLKKRNSRSCRAASSAQVICGNATAIGYDETELLAHYDRKMNPPAAGLKARQDASGNQSFLDRW